MFFATKQPPKQAVILQNLFWVHYIYTVNWLILYTTYYWLYNIFSICIAIIALFGIILIDLYVKYIFVVVKYSVWKGDSENSDTFTQLNNT